ncbi:MAG: hypothetical protein NWE93_00920 [Candidatus Bathyarchaeota archaeon]|nr:hypothetical protein [Candidatus Bathyarchaeota archaeon]
MIEETSKEKEYELIADLAKLLKKYGPEPFEKLAKRICTPEFTEKLANALLTTAAVGRANLANRRPLTPGLESLKETQPEKYQIIHKFLDEFKERRILSTMKDVQMFAIENNLPEIKGNSRSKVISQLTYALMELQPEQLKRLLDELIKQGQSDSSLSQWSEIITKGMARSNKPLSP